MHYIKRKHHFGFTLIEVVVALFIFSILMIAVSSIFTQFFGSYKEVQAMAKNVENSQFVLNRIAKELRTSTVTIAESSRVRFYDYSQDMCLEYRINSVAKTFTVAQKVIALPVDPFTDCDNSGVWVGPQPLIKIDTPSGVLQGSFLTTQSSKTPQRIGKVTASLSVQENAQHVSNFQVTVSLRDYVYVGLQ
ncbi:MAG: PilW family protein [Minisyncoccota bacterium]